MFSRKSFYLVVLGLAGAMALGLVGCGGGSTLGLPFGPGSNATSSERAINALVGVNGGAIDVKQRNVNLNSSPLQLGQVTAYQTVTSGIAIKTDAFQAGTLTQVAPEGSVSMTNTFLYTTIVGGIVGGQGNQGPQVFQVADNFPSSTALAGNASIRLVNLVPNSPPLSLYNTAGSPPTAVAISGLTGFAYNPGPNAASLYQTVATGTYSLTVRDSAGNVLATIAPQMLGAGHSYSVFVTGQVGAQNASQKVKASLVTDN